MREPTLHPALPRAPNDGDQAEGRSAAQGKWDGVRCTTPGCNRKLARSLNGTAVFDCDRCKQRVTITRP